MPLGDPGGGMFEYTNEGLPENLTAVTVNVSEMKRSLAFYRNILKMEVVSETDSESVLSMESFFIILKKSQIVGFDTGIYIGVHDPFEFHRRMVDDGVVFVRHPQRGLIGVYTSFRDPDANVLHAVEKKRKK